MSHGVLFLTLNIGLVLANSVDPDEMPHNVAFHLGLHNLWKYACDIFLNFQSCLKFDVNCQQTIHMKYQAYLVVC